MGKPERITYRGLLRLFQKADKQREKDMAEQKARWAEADKRREEDAAEQKALWDKADKQREKDAAEQKALWAEIAAEQKARWAEADKRREKDAAEQKARWAEADKRREEWEKKINKRIAQIGITAGTVIEEIIMSGVWEKFSSFSYEFEDVFQHVPVYDTIRKKTLTDIDILLAGKVYTISMEVKSHLGLEDVNYHIRQMQMIKEFPPTPVQGKILLGAVGGAHIDADARNRAHELGFFVIELSGDTVLLAKQPSDFQATEW